MSMSLGIQITADIANPDLSVLSDEAQEDMLDKGDCHEFEIGELECTAYIAKGNWDFPGEKGHLIIHHLIFGSATIPELQKLEEKITAWLKAKHLKSTTIIEAFTA